MLIRDATPEDSDSVSERSVSRNCVGAIPKTIDLSYAIDHKGVTLAVGGIKLLNATTAWCWMDWSEECLRETALVYRTVRDWLEALIEDMDLVRVQAAVRTDFDRAIRTVEHLGFERESIMRNFFGEKDAYLYAKIGIKNG